MTSSDDSLFGKSPKNSALSKEANVVLSHIIHTLINDILIMTVGSKTPFEVLYHLSQTPPTEISSLTVTMKLKKKLFKY